MSTGEKVPGVPPVFHVSKAGSQGEILRVNIPGFLQIFLSLLFHLFLNWDLLSSGTL